MTNYILHAAGLGENPNNDATTSASTNYTNPLWGGIGWDIANTANQKTFTPTQIVYPANGYWFGNPVNYLDRVNQGIENGAYLISQLAPQDTFVLIGHNQGAHVISGILQNLQSGGLTSYMPQLLAGLTLANPMRELGHTYTGDPTGATGHGIGGQLLSGTPNLWWDITNEYDLLGNIPTNLSGALTGMFAAVTNLNPVSVPQIVKGFLAAVKGETDTLGNLIRSFVGPIGSGNTALLQWLIKATALLNISGASSFLATAATTALNFRQLSLNYLQSFNL